MTWWLTQNAVGAAILTAGVAALTRVGRFSPSAKHALWLVVLLKLLAPPLFLWSWPVEVPGPVSIPGASTLVAPATPMNTELAKVIAAKALAGIWMAGGAGMALFQGLRLVRLRKRMRQGPATPSWLHDEASSLASRLNVALPRISVIPGAGSPLLVGGFRTTLIIPEALLRGLDRAAWRSVLAHELVHLKRRDHWVGWLELVAACVWWWNPVFWYAWRRLRENAEYACDAWVIRLLPEGRRGYAQSLLSVVDTLSWNATPVGAIGMASGAKSALERRLRMILRDAVPHRMSRFATFGALTLALAILPGWTSPHIAKADQFASTIQTFPTNQTQRAHPTTPTSPTSLTSLTTPSPAPLTIETPNIPDLPKASDNATQLTKTTPASKRATPKVAAQKPARNTKPAPPLSSAESHPAAKPSETTEASVMPGFVRTDAVPTDGLPSKTDLADATVTPGALDMAPAHVESPKTVNTRPSASSAVQKVEVHGSVKIRFNKYSRY